MQEEKIISALYRGILNPMARKIVPGSDYQKYEREAFELEEALLSMLEGQSKEMFQCFIAAQSNLLRISGEDHFTDGFRMGAKFILEIYEKDDEQLKPIMG